MNHKKLYISSILFLLSISLNGYAQKKNLNDDWTFVRLSSSDVKNVIRNQGSDWSSQYNVEHIKGTNNKLSVPADTLRDEFKILGHAKWENVSLPHTAFVENLTVLHPWQGICYYKKVLNITRLEESKQLLLEFEGAMHLADVWINSTHVMQHAGGYTPFVIDATGLLKSDRHNEILVRLDNRNNSLIPPGKPLENLDFCYYSGIYRSVNLIVKPDVHISNAILAGKTASGGIFVTYPLVTKERAKISIQTDLNNKSHEKRNITLRQTLFEWANNKGKGRQIASEEQHIEFSASSGKDVRQEIEVCFPKLWSPASPSLYVLQTSIMENGKSLETEETRIGIRHIEMTKEKGCVINGEPIRLVGSNRHMEYPYVGNAVPVNAQYRDIYQIKTNGFNIVRLGHYPQDKSVLDACDELGLLAIEPIPGWQFFNKNETFLNLTYRDVRDLIRRDRNHPSILMWETTLNESWPPNDWKDRVVAIAHEEYPGNQCFTSGDSYGYEGFDVSYNDWEEGFKRSNNTKNPGFIREYYDYEFGGHYSTSRIKRGDGERAQLQNAWNAQWSHNRYRVGYPATMGDAVWSMYDYNRGCCDNICYSGVADIFRLPKFSLSFFRSQVPFGSVVAGKKKGYEVFIPSYRFNEISDTVMVYGNVDKVELLLNGEVVGSKNADNGPDTDYKVSADGGNCKNLFFPPFTFTNVPTERGTLCAIGYANGRKVASYNVKSPDEPEKLDISYFEGGRKASENDLLIIYVSVKDKNDILCPLNDIDVKLDVEGGEIVGPSVYKTEAGIASFLVKTGKGKKIVLKALTEKMKGNKILVYCKSWN